MRVKDVTKAWRAEKDPEMFHWARTHRKMQSYGICQINTIKAHMDLGQVRQEPEGNLQNRVLYQGPRRPVT
jgi:hypothetical protein